MNITKLGLEYCHLLRWERPAEVQGFSEEEGWGRKTSYILAI
jgi:hypothetical protein